MAILRTSRIAWYRQRLPFTVELDDPRADHTLYTVPANTRAIVRDIRLFVLDPGTVTEALFTLLVRPSGDTGTNYVWTRPVSTWAYLSESDADIVLHAGDRLYSSSIVPQWDLYISGAILPEIA